MKKLCLLLLLALTACAETDPYKRLEPAATPELSETDAGSAFTSRWPWAFRCIQTVTIDFRVETRTLVGYLLVQRPGSFRLQGMTEQGLKLFDLISVDGKVSRVFAADEFDAKILDNIARDISRTFLSVWPHDPAATMDVQADFGLLFARVKQSVRGTRAAIDGLEYLLVGDPPRVDWYEYRQSGRYLYRVNQYEWQEFDDRLLPSVIVLREPGIQSDGPPYKLTIKITELTVRDKPWPEKMFLPPEKDD
jgi:hypothetical protein